MENYVFYNGAQFKYTNCTGQLLVVTINRVEATLQGTRLYFTNDREKKTYNLSVVEAVESLRNVKAVQIA